MTKSENTTDLTTLIAELSRPSAFGTDPDDVRVIQTHISVVFIGGDDVYKVKKPVDFGFVNYGTLGGRRAFCEAEVRLNRRLAPDVYLGVVPITVGPTGLQFGGVEEAVEYAVHMRRLDDSDGLRPLLEEGTVGPDEIITLAHFLVGFHSRASHAHSIAAYAEWDVVAENCHDNFDALAPLVGEAISSQVLERLRLQSESALEVLRPLIERRASSGIPCETHGDLRLEHVYWRRDDDPPFRIVDCIEFSERLRYADPISDLAFLLMDLRRVGFTELATLVAETYLEVAEDPEGAALIPLYTA